MGVKQELAEEIHEASFALLDDPGVRIEHDGIYDALMRAGAKPGGDAQVVRFPRELVMDCVGQAPSKVFFADRDTGGYQIGAEEEPRIWSIPGLNWQHRNAHRPFRSEDMANWARLMTQLDMIASTSLSATGRFSISPSRKSTFP